MQMKIITKSQKPTISLKNWLFFFKEYENILGIWIQIREAALDW